jgi:hypothetical protein
VLPPKGAKQGSRGVGAGVWPSGRDPSGGEQQKLPHSARSQARFPRGRRPFQKKIRPIFTPPSNITLTMSTPPPDPKLDYIERLRNELHPSSIVRKVKPRVAPSSDGSILHMGAVTVVLTKGKHQFIHVATPRRMKYVDRLRYLVECSQVVSRAAASRVPSGAAWR